MIISKLLSLKLLKDIHLFLGLTIHGFVVKFIRYLHQTYHKIFTSCLCFRIQSAKFSFLSV